MSASASPRDARTPVFGAGPTRARRPRRPEGSDNPPHGVEPAQISVLSFGKLCSTSEVKYEIIMVVGTITAEGRCLTTGCPPLGRGSRALDREERYQPRSATQLESGVAGARGRERECARLVEAE